MIDRAEIERCRSLLIGGSLFVAAMGFILHPFLLISGGLLIGWLWVLWLGMQTGGLPRRFERWSCRSDRNLRITIVAAYAINGFFLSGWVVSFLYFLLPVVLPADWLR